MDDRTEGEGLPAEDPLLDELFFDDEVGEAAWEWATSPDQVIPL